MKTGRRDLLGLLGLGSLLLVLPAGRRKAGNGSVGGSSGEADDERSSASGPVVLSWPVNIPEKAVPRDIGPGMDLAG